MYRDTQTHTQREEREGEGEKERRFIRVVQLRLREEVGRNEGSLVVVQVTMLDVLARLQNTPES